MRYKKLVSMNDFKKLKPRKILPKPENMEWNDGMEYFIFSPVNKTMTKRLFHPVGADIVKIYLLDEVLFQKVE